MVLEIAIFKTAARGIDQNLSKPRKYVYTEFSYIIQIHF